MGRNIQEISAKIDNLAQKGCRLLTQEEKEKFFEECNVKRYYIKGQRKGEERDIYEIDGKCFNEIWKLITPYVFISCSRSVYYNSIAAEDAISEVKYMLFYVLQRFGPIFNNQTISQRLSIIVNISLTNLNNKKSKEIETLPFSYMLNDEESPLDVEDINSNMKYIDFWCDIPDRIKGCVEHVISGSTIGEVRKFFNNSKIQEELLQFVSKS